MSKRFSITVSDWQSDALEEIAAHREVSVGNVVRDALRAQLPRELELARWLVDPGADPELARDVVDHLERLELHLGERQFEGEGESPEVVIDDVGDAPPRRFRRPSPPSGNTGAHE